METVCLENGMFGNSMFGKQYFWKTVGLENSMFGKKNDKTLLFVTIRLSSLCWDRHVLEYYWQLYISVYTARATKRSAERKRKEDF